MLAIFLFRKMGNNPVNRADSGEIHVFVEFPGNLIQEISTNLRKCVGGAYLRGIQPIYDRYIEQFYL